MIFEVCILTFLCFSLRRVIELLEQIRENTEKGGEEK